MDRMKEMCFLTFDIDWVSDHILEDLLMQLSDFNVKATFFATHKTGLLENVDRDNYEIALHPNYRGKNSSEIESVIHSLKDIYPEAVGVRSHGLYFGSDYLNSWLKYDIRYDSNIYLPYESNINAHMHCSGLYRIPYFWDDDTHLGYGYDFDWSKINFKATGLKVFSFHPVHIYYNSDSHLYYQKIKEQNYPSLDEVKVPEDGIKSMFVSLLEYIKVNNIKTGCLKDIYMSHGGNI